MDAPSNAPSNAKPMPVAMHVRTYATYATNERIQDSTKSASVLNAPKPVDNDICDVDVMAGWSTADHAFAAFLAGLTPSRVLRDRRPVTGVERKRLQFFVQKAAVERERFTSMQLRVAAEWAERQERTA